MTILSVLSCTLNYVCLVALCLTLLSQKHCHCFCLQRHSFARRIAINLFSEIRLCGPGNSFSILHRSCSHAHHWYIHSRFPSSAIAHYCRRLFCSTTSWHFYISYMPLSLSVSAFSSLLADGVVAASSPSISPFHVTRPTTTVHLAPYDISTSLPALHHSVLYIAV